MAVTALLDALIAHLQARLAGAAAVGVAAPAATGDLPLVALSLPVVEQHLLGVGRRPAESRTGALGVTRNIDLADPTAAGVDLLSADRTVLQLPHGAIVRADGSDQPPFTPADLGIELGGTTFTPTTGQPVATGVRPDPVTGLITFGAALPAAGTLRLRYFVGTWEVVLERYAGELVAETFAAAVDGALTVSAAVAAALASSGAAALPPVPGLSRLDPRAVGAVIGGGLTGDLASTRVRSLTYRFDFELETPQIVTAGGPIRQVDVRLQPGPNNDFTVAREGN